MKWTEVGESERGKKWKREKGKCGKVGIREREKRVKINYEQTTERDRENEGNSTIVR